MPKKLDPGTRTRDLGPIHCTRDPEPSARDLSARTWNLGPIGKNWDPGSWTLYVETYYIETSPLICLDWLFYDGDLRYERVN